MKMNEKATLEEWTHCFGIASSSSEVFSEDLLQAMESFKEMAWIFKTPNKSAQKTEDDELKELLNLWRLKIFTNKRSQAQII
jgi:hypothetical protein